MCVTLWSRRLKICQFFFRDYRSVGGCKAPSELLCNARAFCWRPSRLTQRPHNDARHKSNYKRGSHSTFIYKELIALALCLLFHHHTQIRLFFKLKLHRTSPSPTNVYHHVSKRKGPHRMSSCTGPAFLDVANSFVWLLKPLVYPIQM
jgi:hypothetical protein